MIDAGEKDTSVIKAEIIKMLETEPLAKIDYVETVNFENMEPIEKVQGQVLTAIAVYIGKTRLIDNFITDSMN